MTGATDFDFLHGSWRVRHRRLRKRLAGDTQWQEFGGTMSLRPILAGLGNFDENVIDLPDGRYQACTIRLYDPTADAWTIRWIDGRDPKLDPPMTGQFAQGVGSFFGNDRMDDRAIRIRFLWTRIDQAAPRWEQAFSGDGGASWETNWSMDFDRA